MHGSDRRLGSWKVGILPLPPNACVQSPVTRHGRRRPATTDDRIQSQPLFFTYSFSFSHILFLRVHLAQEEKRREDAPSHPMVGFLGLASYSASSCLHLHRVGTGTGGPHFTWERDTTGPPAAGPVSGPDRSLTTTMAGSRQQDSPSQFAVDSDSPRRHPSLHSQKCDPAAAAPQQLQG